MNQDVLVGCWHLSLWTVRGAGWGKMLSRHFPLFSRKPLPTGKDPIQHGSSAAGVYVAIVWICLAQRVVHIQLCAVWKWRLGRFHCRPCEVRLLVQRMASFNEVRIHNQFACHVMVHIINIKPSSTPLSLRNPGLDVHSPTLPASIFHSVVGCHPFHTSFPACCLCSLAPAWRVLMRNQLCGVAASSHWQCLWHWITA